MFLLMMSDDVSDLCDRPGGSRMTVNSRIMRVDQCFFWKMFLRLYHGKMTSIVRPAMNFLSMLPETKYFFGLAWYVLFIS